MKMFLMSKKKNPSSPPKLSSNPQWIGGCWKPFRPSLDTISTALVGPLAPLHGTNAIQEVLPSGGDANGGNAGAAEGGRDHGLDIQIE